MIYVLVAVVLLLVCAVVEWLRRRRLPAVLLVHGNPFASLRAQHARDQRQFLAKVHAALDAAPFVFDPVAFDASRAAMTSREMRSLRRIVHAAEAAEAGVGFGADDTWDARCNVLDALRRIGCPVDFDEWGGGSNG